MSNDKEHMRDRIKRWEHRAATAPPPVVHNKQYKENKAASTIQRAWRRFHATRVYKHRLKLHRYRTRVAQEILATEKSYVAILTHVRDDFIQPLQQAVVAKKGIITEPEIKAIFSHLEIILNYNQIFCGQIENRVTHWSPVQKIGDIFLKMTDFLKVYTQYVNDYQHSNMTLLQCQKHNPKFDAFIKLTFQRLHSSPVLANQIGNAADLPTLLIAPIQRIPRYKLLLEDLLKHTWADHCDYKDLRASVEKIAFTAEYLNERAREAKNISKVIEIQLSLIVKDKEEKVNIVAPDRRFVREGLLDLIENTASTPRRDSTTKPQSGKTTKIKRHRRLLCLFTDCLLLCKLPRGTPGADGPLPVLAGPAITDGGDTSRYSQRVFIAKIPLKNLRVVCLADDTMPGGGAVDPSSGVNLHHGFEITGPRDLSLWFCSASVEEKTAWVHDLTTAIHDFEEKQKFLEEQQTRAAATKAEQAKTLIAEQYASMRAQGRRYDSLRRERGGSDGDKEGVSPLFSADGEQIDVDTAEPPPADSRVRLWASGANAARHGLWGSGRLYAGLSPEERLAKTLEAKERLEELQEEEKKFREEQMKKAEEQKEKIQQSMANLVPGRLSSGPSDTSAGLKYRQMREAAKQKRNSENLENLEWSPEHADHKAPTPMYFAHPQQEPETNNGSTSPRSSLAATARAVAETSTRKRAVTLETIERKLQQAGITIGSELLLQERQKEQKR